MHQLNVFSVLLLNSIKGTNVLTVPQRQSRYYLDKLDI